MLSRQLWTFLFAVLLTATAFLTFPGLGRPRASSPAFARQYAVKIIAGHSQGSGVVIGNITYNVGHPAIHSLVLTCAHVLTADFQTDSPRTVVVERDGKLYRGRVVASDNYADLSLIEVSEHWKAIRLYRGKVAAGLPEIAVGYPLATHLQITQGFVGDENRIRGLVPGGAVSGHPAQREGSAAMWPGNSGGAVYINDAGGWRFVGIAERISVSHDLGLPQLAPTISYFITADTIARFLRANRIE